MAICENCEKEQLRTDESSIICEICHAYNKNMYCAGEGIEHEFREKDICKCT